MSINIESSYSFNGSLIKKDTLSKFKDLGYKSLGLVDKTTAFFLTFYKELKKLNIKPILGYRITSKYFDYILYPKNFIGYKEILEYASTIDNKKIQDLDSLIISSNILYCLDITYLENDNIIYLNKEYNELKEKNVLVYTGVDFSYYPCEVSLYPLIKNDYKSIIINKVKYLNEDDKKASEVLESIMTSSVLKEATLFDIGRISSNHLKPYLEFVKEYSEYKELLNNTLDFIDLISIEIEFKDHFPKYETRNDLSSIDYLKALSLTGLKRRLKSTTKDYKRYKERLDYELSIIEKMGFSDYFLVVYDYILYAKKNNVYVGPGRGSGASSLVSYSLGIIDIDPLEYDLYFERFLNPDRLTKPDIDTDFEDTKKDDVIRYCERKYGKNYVSLVSTYQTLLGKGTLRDVSKVLDIDPLNVDFLSKELSSDDNSISSLLKKANIVRFYNSNKEIKELIDISMKIEGIPKSIGTHASAVIISDEPLTDYTEIHLMQNGFYQTVYDADSIKDIGLVKMDFLSLTTLSTIHEIIDEINLTHENKVTLYNIPLNDEKTFKLFREKPLTGIFQFETPGMSAFIKRLLPIEFKDLSIATAINRPGSISYANEYLNRKNRVSRVEYYDPCLKGILDETLGIIVYQEQLMAICNIYSGLTLAESDILRRAISEKNHDLLLNLKAKFYSGAKLKNRNILVTEKLFSDILKFADFGFNKSHSIVYARVSYIAAYLKANYPSEFMANLLKHSNQKIIKECKIFNLRVIPPDLRYSSYKYKIVKNNLIMPFTEIKGIGDEYSSIIEKIAHSGDIAFEKVISRSKGALPRSLIETLILSGAFDYTGYNKKTMISSLDSLYEFDPTMIRGLNYKIIKEDEYPFEYLKNRENELLGFNPKYHPLVRYQGELKKLSDISLGVDGVTIIAYLSDLKTLKTKNNDTMAQFYLEDEFISTKAVLFSSDYYKCAHFLENNKIYEIFGSYKENRGEPQFVVRTIKKLENV